jgi:hypothetical protein
MNAAIDAIKRQLALIGDDVARAELQARNNPSGSQYAEEAEVFLADARAQAAQIIKDAEQFGITAADLGYPDA